MRAILLLLALSLVACDNVSTATTAEACSKVCAPCKAYWYAARPRCRCEHACVLPTPEYYGTRWWDPSCRIDGGMEAERP